MTSEPMPSEQRRALADLCRFDCLKKFNAGYAARDLHLPELANSSATIDALSRARLAVFEPATGKVFATLRGRDRLDELNAERLGAAQ